MVYYMIKEFRNLCDPSDSTFNHGNNIYTYDSQANLPYLDIGKILLH